MIWRRDAVKPSMIGVVRTGACDDAGGQQGSIEVEVGADDVGGHGCHLFAWKATRCVHRHISRE